MSPEPIMLTVLAMDWYSRTWDLNPEPKSEPPRPKLLEAGWLVKGPSGHPITCAIYETIAEYIELRAGYSFDYVIRSQLVGRIEAGRALAAQRLTDAFRSMEKRVATQRPK